MRIFVTGASGWIGSAVVPELIGAGHQVVGLARSEESSAALTAAGAEVRRGSLDDVDVLRDAALDSDGIIHLAFKHDLSFTGDFLGATSADRRAIEVFGEALAHSDRPLVIASGLLGVTPGSVATEADGHGEPGAGSSEGLGGRHSNAELTLSFASHGVRSCVVRLPPTVHGTGDRGFISTLVDIARSTGFAGYLGDGSSRWPAGHQHDVARLFRLAVEHAPAGTTLHANGEEGVSTRDIAAAIGRGLSIETASVAAEDAAHFTWLASFVGVDSPASSAATRQLLGWDPTGIGLIDDLDLGHYFSD